jgi:bla regulator protein BlaR1
MKRLYVNKKDLRYFYKVMLVKKSTCFILAFLICLGFTGCNKANDNNNNTIVENTSTIPASPTIIGSQETSTENNTPSAEVKVTQEKAQIKVVDYSDSFDGIEGCAVFYNSDANVYNMYNEELCVTRTSPCSTFKIMATLMGLENEVLSSVDSKMGYDKTIYPMDSWNGDLSLKDAFKESCVWYFRKVIDKVGQSNVQSYLDKLEYGNNDISEWDGSGINSLPELNGFWLESSLEISPKEQVDTLVNIFDGKTDFAMHNISILKEVMLTQKIVNISVYGKTGTGQNIITKHRDNGWFVGMFENSDERYYFAVRLNDEKKEVSGSMAKEIAIKLISRYYVEK